MAKKKKKNLKRNKVTHINNIYVCINPNAELQDAQTVLEKDIEKAEEVFQKSGNSLWISLCSALNIEKDNRYRLLQKLKFLALIVAAVFFMDNAHDVIMKFVPNETIACFTEYEQGQDINKLENSIRCLQFELNHQKEIDELKKNNRDDIDNINREHREEKSELIKMYQNEIDKLNQHNLHLEEELGNLKELKA